MTDQELADNVRRTYEEFKAALEAARARGIYIHATYRVNERLSADIVPHDQLVGYSLEINKFERL
jgi:DNA invertase Pin-like site-specific DNA recombinase